MGLTPLWVKVSEIAVRSASLDDVFLTLTGHAAEEKAKEEEEKTAKAQPGDRGPVVALVGLAIGWRILFLPLTFISTAFAPSQGMPGWLQPVAEWNPMSSLAAACRSLFGNPNPAAYVHVWPAQHPELAVLCWSVGLLVVFAPLAIRLYGNKVR
jgi:hypothetical protein